MANSALPLQVRREALAEMLATQAQNSPADPFYLGFSASIPPPSCTPAVSQAVNEGGPVTPVVRQRLADWILELTELFQLERDMFCTAINFVDRYLSIRRIDHLYQLQKLGACALMIAAKFVGSAPLAVDDLCGLMDNIFSPAELKAFELELLHELEWRLITPKPHDFLEEFLLALPLAVTPLEADQLRRHAAIFIDMCYTDYKFICYGPAVIAATALYWSCLGVGTSSTTSWIAVPRTLQQAFLQLPAYFSPADQAKLSDCIHEAHLLFSTYDLVPRAKSEPVASPVHGRDAALLAIIQ